MSAQGSRRRKSAASSQGRFVRASILIGVREHAVWAAAAALAGMDRGAFAVEAIRAACSGLIVIDKRKPAPSVKLSDRPDPEPCVSDPGPEPAA